MNLPHLVQIYFRTSDLDAGMFQRSIFLKVMNHESLPSNWSEYSGIINHNKYANNYDYNKAIYLVNKEEFSDTGYLLMKKSSGISIPGGSALL